MNPGFIVGDGSTGSPIKLQDAPTAGQIIKWTGTKWDLATVSSEITTSGFITGDGSSGSPIRFINGSATGQVPMWDNGLSSWSATLISTSSDPGFITGDGSTGSPIKLLNGVSSGQIIKWTGTKWDLATVSSEITTSGFITGDGSSGSPIRLIDADLPNQIPMWDGSIWQKQIIQTSVAGFTVGDGSVSNPIKLRNGTSPEQIIVWNGVQWDLGTVSAEVHTSGFITGDGSLASPIKLVDGTSASQLIQWNGSAWNTISGLTPTVYYVSGAGNDGTAVVNNQFRAWLTIDAAKVAAAADVTAQKLIIVFPGTYTTSSNLAFNGAKYLFYPGAVITSSSTPFIINADPMDVRIFGQSVWSLSGTAKLLDITTASAVSTVYMQIYSVIGNASAIIGSSVAIASVVINVLTQLSNPGGQVMAVTAGTIVLNANAISGTTGSTTTGVISIGGSSTVSVNIQRITGTLCPAFTISGFTGNASIVANGIISTGVEVITGSGGTGSLAIKASRIVNSGTGAGIMISLALGTVSIYSDIYTNAGTGVCVAIGTNGTECYVAGEQISNTNAGNLGSVVTMSGPCQVQVSRITTANSINAVSASPSTLSSLIAESVQGLSITTGAGNFSADVAVMSKPGAATSSVSIGANLKAIINIKIGYLVSTGGFAIHIDRTAGQDPDYSASIAVGFADGQVMSTPAGTGYAGTASPEVNFALDNFTSAAIASNLFSITYGIIKINFGSLFIANSVPIFSVGDSGPAAVMTYTGSATMLGYMIYNVTSTISTLNASSMFTLNSQISTFVIRFVSCFMKTVNVGGITAAVSVVSPISTSGTIFQTCTIATGANDANHLSVSKTVSPNYTIYIYGALTTTRSPSAGTNFIAFSVGTVQQSALVE